MAKDRRTVRQRANDRIRATKIIDKFQRHIEDPEKTPLLMTQVHAGKALLNKVIPDLKAVEHSGEINGKDIERWTTADIVRRIGELVPRASETETRPRKLN